MDEIVLKVKFSEEMNDVIYKGGVFLALFIVLLYLFLIVYTVNLYFYARTQEKLVNYYNAERL
jgi:cell division protein FtsX